MVTELWERSAALASLEELLRDSAAGGRAVLIPGEAGIGKSALVKAFAARFAPRMRLLWGMCDPLITPRALGPLHDIARQARGMLADRLGAGGGQAELFAALLEELSGPRQRARPVVVVEDAHWADEATLDLLVFLARRIERLAALLVVTYRDDELGAEHPLRAALAAMPSDVVRRLTLPMLSSACVAEQAARAGRDGAGVYGLTGGNPLLVTEVLAGGDQPVPATVRELILARLRGVPAPARDLARLVAVLPTRAHPAILRGRDEHVEQCVAAGVLVPAGDGVSYRHELLRQAVEDALTGHRRKALHGRALALLAGVDEIDPAQLVHHAWYCGDTEALLHHGAVAAARAATLGAHREAVAHFRLMRPHAGRLSSAERARLLEGYASEAHLAGAYPEALEVRRAALAERERLGERDRIGENLRWISRLLWLSGRGAEAKAAAVEAVEVLRAGPPGRELAMAYSNRSQLHLVAHEVAEAVEWGERARVLADGLGDVETAVHAAINVSSVRLRGGDLAASVALWQAHVRADAAGMVDHAARALVNRATTLLRQFGEPGVVALADAFGYVTAHELDGYLQYLLGVRAMVNLERCAWEAALADARESLGLVGGVGASVVPALVVLGRIQAARGADDALSTLDVAADRANGVGDLQWVGLVAAARAEYFLLAEDPARAAGAARAALPLATANGHRLLIDELSYRLWRAGGAPAAPAGQPTPYAMLMAGDWAAAAAAWAAEGRQYSRVEALSAGDRPAAGEALRILHALGATRSIRRLRAQLRHRGVTGLPRGPRPATAANPAGLTPRQSEVLRLLAEGLSNADMAQRLTLSPKTIEHHVAAILDKLGVTTRGQAIAAAHRRNLVR